MTLTPKERLEVARELYQAKRQATDLQRAFDDHEVTAEGSAVYLAECVAGRQLILAMGEYVDSIDEGDDDGNGLA